MSETIKKYLSIDAIIFALFLAYTFIVPFMVWPLKGKIQPSDIIFGVLFLLLLYSWRGSLRLVFTKPFSPFLPLFLIIVFVSSFAHGFNKAILLEFLGMVYLMVSMIVTCIIINSRSRWNIFLKVWRWSLWAVILSSLISYFAYRFFSVNTTSVQFLPKYPYFGDIRRIVGPFQNSKLFITYLFASLLIMAISFRNAKNFRNKTMQGLAIFLLFISGLLSPSRITYMLFIMPPLLYIFINRNRIKKVVFWVVAIGAIVLFVATEFCTHFVPEQYMYSLNSNNNKSNSNAIFTWSSLGAKRINLSGVTFIPSYYFELKRIAITAFRRHPLLGVGQGRFSAYISSLKNHKELPDDFPPFDPHSTVFGLLAETGILGTVCIILFFAAILKRWLISGMLKPQESDSVTLSTFFLFLSVFLLISLDLDILNFRFLWLLIGSGLAFERLVFQDKRGG